MIRLERNVARNFRRLCSDSPEDMISAEECRTRLKLGTGWANVQKIEGYNNLVRLKECKRILGLVNVEP